MSIEAGYGIFDLCKSRTKADFVIVAVFANAVIADTLLIESSYLCKTATTNLFVSSRSTSRDLCKFII